MKLRLIFATLVLSATLGCSHSGYVQHPGTINVFSSQTYDTLVSADAVIKQVKIDLGNNVFPAGWVPNIKKALNAAIAAYNTADLTWQAYNASATGTTQAQLQAQVNTLNGTLTNLSSAQGGAGQ